MIITAKNKRAFFVFGDKEYEFRIGDESSQAGTKYKIGDLVYCCDRELRNGYGGTLVVVSAPKERKSKSEPWENYYELAYIEDFSHRSARVGTTTLHEADLEFVSDKKLERDLYKEQIMLLQRIVSGKLQIPDELKKQIFSGQVLFDRRPSWREIPELKE